MKRKTKGILFALGALVVVAVIFLMSHLDGIKLSDKNDNKVQKGAVATKDSSGKACDRPINITVNVNGDEHSKPCNAKPRGNSGHRAPQPKRDTAFVPVPNPTPPSSTMKLEIILKEQKDSSKSSPRRDTLFVVEKEKKKITTTATPSDSCKPSENKSHFWGKAFGEKPINKKPWR